MSKTSQQRVAYFEAALICLPSIQLMTLMDEKSRYMAIAVPDIAEDTELFLAATVDERALFEYLNEERDLLSLLVPNKELFYLRLDPLYSGDPIRLDAFTSVPIDAHLPQRDFFARGHTENYAPCASLCELHCRNDFNDLVHLPDTGEKARIAGYMETADHQCPLLLLGEEIVPAGERNFMNLRKSLPEEQYRELDIAIGNRLADFTRIIDRTHLQEGR